MTPQQLFPDHERWVEVPLTSYIDLIRQPNQKIHWLKRIKNIHAGFDLYGGFLENRSPLFDERHDPRLSIHLGVDFWLDEGTKVFFPYGGEVIDVSPCSDTKGGWGGRIDIFSKEHVFIFGHLEAPTFSVGTKIVPGMFLGRLASRELNGGWLPHLHVQVVTLGCYNSFLDPRAIDAYAKPSIELPLNYIDPLLI